MENAALRLRIRQKLQDGRLPLNDISRIWGGPPAGEHCDAYGQRRHETPSGSCG